MSIKMYRMLFLRCVCTRQTLTYNAIYIYSIKVCIRSVKIFSFCPFLSLSLFSLSLLASLDLFHLIGLVLCQVTRREKKRERRRGRRRSIIVLNRLFFLLSSVWWTQVIREKERMKRLKSFHNYACVSYNQGQSSERTHIHSYTTRMMMMMMIQFYIFNIDT